MTKYENEKFNGGATEARRAKWRETWKKRKEKFHKLQEQQSAIVDAALDKGRKLTEKETARISVLHTKIEEAAQKMKEAYAEAIYHGPTS